MNKIKEFLSENKKLSYAFLFIWSAACVFAVFYGAKANSAQFNEICEYVKNTIDSRAETSEIIKNGIYTDIKLYICVLIISLSPFICPGAFLIAGAKGFACGMTSVILFKLYGIKATAPVFAAIVFPQVLGMPIYITMLILAVKYPFSRLKSDKTETVYDKRKQWFSLALLQLIMTGVLIILSIGESFMMQLIPN